MQKKLILGFFLCWAAINAQGLEEAIDPSIGKEITRVHLNFSRHQWITAEDVSFLYSIVFEQNHNLTIDNYHRANALGLLGKYYLRSNQYNQMHTCIGQVAELSDESAKYALFCMLEGMRSRYYQAFSRVWDQQCKQDNYDALCSVGILHYYGIGHEQDREISFQVFNKIAQESAAVEGLIHPVARAMLAKQGLAR